MCWNNTNVSVKTFYQIVKEMKIKINFFRSRIEGGDYLQFFKTIIKYMEVYKCIMKHINILLPIYHKNA